MESPTESLIVTLPFTDMPALIATFELANKDAPKTERYQWALHALVSGGLVEMYFAGQKTKDVRSFLTGAKGVTMQEGNTKVAAFVQEKNTIRI